jgi:xylulokinase
MGGGTKTVSFLIGIDLGTSETKAGLFDPEGNLLYLARQGYPIITEGETGCAEQDPERWWYAVCQALQDVAHYAARHASQGELAALCVQGQGPSVVMADEQGKPLNNAILWMDTRPCVQRDQLSLCMGRPVSPFAHMPMAMWMAEQRPEAFSRARWFLAAWDFVAMRLCGQPLASALAYFQPFPEDEVEASGLPSRLFPPVVEAGQPIAGLTAAAAEATGLPEGLPVVAGVHDGIATFIGAGLVEPGRSADVNGTSGGLALCWTNPLQKPGIFSATWIHPGEYIVGGAMAALGKCLDWVHETVAGPGMAREDLIQAAIKTPVGADRLIFLPYLAGERAPIWDPKARGVFFGLTLNHRQEHLARAVLESVAYALRHVAEELLGSGARIDEMRVCGGQAQSEEWNQIKADIVGVPVAVPRVREAALTGAAVLAGVGAGLLPNITEGANQMVRIDAVLEPNPVHHRQYTELFQVYKRLYPDLRSAFHQLCVTDQEEEC